MDIFFQNNLRIYRHDHYRGPSLADFDCSFRVILRRMSVKPARDVEAEIYVRSMALLPFEAIATEIRR